MYSNGFEIAYFYLYNIILGFFFSFQNIKEDVFIMEVVELTAIIYIYSFKYILLNEWIILMKFVKVNFIY